MVIIFLPFMSAYTCIVFISLCICAYKYLIAYQLSPSSNLAALETGWKWTILTRVGIYVPVIVKIKYCNWCRTKVINVKSNFPHITWPVPTFNYQARKTSPQVMALLLAATEHGGGGKQTGQCQLFSRQLWRPRDEKHTMEELLREGAARWQGVRVLSLPRITILSSGERKVVCRGQRAPLNCNICLDISVSAFSDFNKALISLPPFHHQSHNSSSLCPFWQKLRVNNWQWASQWWGCELYSVP